MYRKLCCFVLCVAVCGAVVPPRRQFQRLPRPNRLGLQPSFARQEAAPDNVPHTVYGPPPQPEYGPPPPQEYGPPPPTTEQAETTTEIPAETTTEAATTTEPSAQKLRKEKFTQQGAYYIYHPSGLLQRVTYGTRDDVKNMAFSAQLQYQNVEPIREPIFTYDPKTFVLRRLQL